MCRSGGYSPGVRREWTTLRRLLPVLRCVSEHKTVLFLLVSAGFSLFAKGLRTHRSPPVCFSEPDFTVRDRMRNMRGNHPREQELTVVIGWRTLGYSRLIPSFLHKTVKNVQNLCPLIINDWMSDGWTTMRGGPPP